jgi:hypothetical protein
MAMPPKQSAIDRGDFGIAICASHEEMKLTSKERIRLVGVCLGIWVSSALLAPAEARNPTQEEQQTSIHLASASVTPADAEAIRQRVANALHADPYLYDRHVTVSVEEGRIVLRGFVFGDWDLRNALRIARQSAGGLTVVDNLSIKEGGRS